MENNIEDKLEVMKRWLDASCLSHFFEEAESFLVEYPAYPELKDNLDRLRDDYGLLFDCYEKGVVDPKRDNILDLLSYFSGQLYYDFCMVAKIEKYSFLQAARKRAKQIDLLQVAELLPSKMGDMEWYNAVFSSILVSWQWDVNKSKYFTQLLSSPGIDLTFARLAFSAIMLSSNCIFDRNKAKCLADVCASTVDLMVRLYAEVALAFCVASYGDNDIFLMMCQIIEPLMHRPEICEEFQELQKQSIICTNAVIDSVQVDAELISSLPVSRMPKFMKNDDLDDTAIDEILHPESEEDASEKLEASVRKMLAMQQAGSDIYYNGFSKMKNFPFFRRLSNWFLPFYVENPALEPLLKALDGDERMLKSLAESYTFCQSDKYSFAFAVEFSLKHELAQMKSFIKEGMMFGGGSELLDVDQVMFVRRMYLQDLYRFFNVSPFKDAFVNPFSRIENSGGLFLKPWSAFYSDQLMPALMNVCRFVYKRKDFDILASFSIGVDPALPEHDELTWYFIQSEFRVLRYEHALVLMESLSDEFRNTVQCIRLKAKCELFLDDFESALVDFTLVQEKKPALSNQIKIAYCQLMLGEVEKAMSLLFELDYKHPNNPDVMRSLAWGHLQRKNVDAAIAIYQKLQQMFKMESPDFDPEDIYNEGLCNWLQKDLKKASVAFHEYMELAGVNMDELGHKIQDDNKLLESYGINHWDVALMRDSIHVED